MRYTTEITVYCGESYIIIEQKTIHVHVKCTLMFFIQQNILLVWGDEADKLLDFRTLNSSNIIPILNKYRNKNTQTGPSVAQRDDGRELKMKLSYSHVSSNEARVLSGNLLVPTNK